MSPRITFADLVGENAFQLVGLVAGLLRQLDRAAEIKRESGERYRTEALNAGTYEEMIRITHRYAKRYLKDTLQVEDNVEPYLRDYGRSLLPEEE